MHDRLSERRGLWVRASQVIGFVDFDLTPAQRLPLQVAGPASLAATCVIVVLGVVFSRLWRNEMRRQRREMALKARIQLQSLAGDLIAHRVVHKRGRTRARRRPHREARQHVVDGRSTFDADRRRRSSGPTAQTTAAAAEITSE